MMKRARQALIAGVFLLTGLPVDSSGASLPQCQSKPATIVGRGNEKIIDGTNGPDVIVVLGRPVTVRARGGDDLICVRGKGRRAITIFGGRGRDLIFGSSTRDKIYGGRGHDVIYGRGGEDEIFGERGRDLLYGGDGPDYLNGGNGRDVMRGQRGSDYLVGDDGDDVICGGGNGRFGDTVSYYMRFVDRNRTLTDQPKAVHVDLMKGRASGVGHDRLCGVENVVGSESDDVLSGDNRDNVLEAADGDDLIVGRGGNDCLVPARGNDVLRGGPGYDFYTSAYSLCRAPSPIGSISPTTQGVTVDLTEGYATVNLESEGNRSTLISIEGAFGSSDEDILIGDDSANLLAGAGAPDYIEGRGGDDTLLGGKGEDTGDGGSGHDICTTEIALFCEDSVLKRSLLASFLQAMGRVPMHIAPHSSSPSLK